MERSRSKKQSTNATIIKADDIDVEITPKQHGKILAFVKIKYAELEISGFRVMRSSFDQDGIFVQPPSIPTASGKWLRVFWIKRPELWKELELKIRSAFLKEYSDTINEEEETVSIEDVLGCDSNNSNSHVKI